MDRDYGKHDEEQASSDNNQEFEQNATDETREEADNHEAMHHENRINEATKQDEVDEFKIDSPDDQAHYQKATDPKDSDPRRERKRPTKWGSFIRMVAAAILGSVITLGAITQLDYFQPDGEVPEQDIESTTTDQADDSAAEPVVASGSVADIVDGASDAIVGIVNLTEQQNPFTQSNGKDGEEVERGVGSGVIYKVTDDEAYIVTNNHVIEDASSLQVSLANGDTIDGELVGTDPLTDIAVVKVEGDYDMKPIKLGDSDNLRSGDQVTAIGNPLGLDLSRTVTQGIVSAIDRTIPVQTSVGEWEFDVIQTDAAINPGNSGGALLNSAGELVGINSLKINENGVEGLGFSIPSNEVKELIDELVDNGKIVRPYAGVGIKSINEIPPHYLQNIPNKVQDGAVVLSVDEQSAAAKADIEVEDVIVGIDGEDVKDAKDFRTHLYKNSIGDKVKVDLYHDGEKKTVELTLASNADIN